LFSSLFYRKKKSIFVLFIDSNDEVEKTCHRVIVDMEATLGESLQDYFNN